MTPERRAALRKEARAAWAKKTPQERLESLARLYTEIGEALHAELQEDDAATRAEEAREIGKRAAEALRKAFEEALKQLSKRRQLEGPRFLSPEENYAVDQWERLHGRKRAAHEAGGADAGQ